MSTSNVIPIDRHAARSHPATSRQTERAVYTVRQVADLLGIALGSAYALVRQGEIPAKQLGHNGRWVIPKRRFHAWLDEEEHEFDEEPMKAGTR